MSSTKPNKLFALVDCNNFYVSCERVFNPKLLNRPVVVLSNNDGCVIARSNEAKAIGIPMGAPYFQFRDQLQRHRAAVLSSNYTLYGDMSHRVVQTLLQFALDLEVYSIDEAFLLIENIHPESLARQIRETVRQWTGIPVSVGIAPTKTLAKIANRLAKKNDTLNGVFQLPASEAELEVLLDHVGVEDVWGIGFRHAARLSSKGILTAKDLRHADDQWIKKEMSVVGLRTVWELRGVSCLSLDEAPPAKQSITSSQAFGRPLETFEEMRCAVSSFVARAAEKMRAQGSLATYLSLFVEQAPFRSGYTQTKLLLPEPTDYTPTLTSYALEGLKTLFLKGIAYRKAGVILSGLVSKDWVQQDLYTSTRASTQQQKLMQTTDALNKRFGKKTAFFASEGVDRSWKMKQEKKTPAYTTNWNELLTIRL